MSLKKLKVANNENLLPNPGASENSEIYKELTTSNRPVDYVTVNSEEIKSSGKPDENRGKERYLERYVNLCKLISMWPRENTNIFRYYFVYITILCVSTYMIQSMYVHILFHASDIDRVAQVVDYATVFTSGLFRYIYSYFKGKKYTELVDFMNEKFVHTSLSPRNIVTMDKYVRVAKYICYTYFVLTQGWLIQLSFWPFVQYYIDKNKQYENGTLVHPDASVKMAVETGRPFDTSVQPNATIYYALHIMTYFAMLFIYVFTDAFWFSTLILTTGQFELISHSLTNIQEESEDENETDMENVTAVLNSCLKQHDITREFVHKIEDLMHPIVLVDFLHAVASISFILLDMTLAIFDFNVSQASNLMGYLFVSIFHMYVLDYFGNELSLKEQEISTAFYSIPWYKFPESTKSKVIVAITVADKPYKLTGGKLYNVSLEFFAATMRTIFSYFMVLLQLREA